MRKASRGSVAAAAVDFAEPPLSTLALHDLDKIVEVGDIASVSDLSKLLTAARSPVGAGSAERRLIRVLKENGRPHTPSALQDAIKEKLAIDEKILRGRLKNAPKVGERVHKRRRAALIGGHSALIRKMPETFALSDVKDEDNGTFSARFRMVAREDANGMVAAVDRNDRDNVIAVFEAHAGVGTRWLDSPPGLNALAGETDRANHAQSVTRGKAAMLLFNDNVLNARAAAKALIASGDLKNATHMAKFVDAVVDANASAKAILKATKALLEMEHLSGVTPEIRTDLGQADKNLDTTFANFETHGPVMTIPKSSTLAPARMSEDEVLALCDHVTALKPKLFRDGASNSVPVDGSSVTTKQQIVKDDILWIGMKDRVVYSRMGGRVEFFGGAVVSFYPTRETVLPPDPAGAVPDKDGFFLAH